MDWNARNAGFGWSKPAGASEALQHEGESNNCHWQRGSDPPVGVAGKSQNKYRGVAREILKIPQNLWKI
jgi:hypothetical protein